MAGTSNVIDIRSGRTPVAVPTADTFGQAVDKHVDMTIKIPESLIDKYSKVLAKGARAVYRREHELKIEPKSYNDFKDLTLAFLRLAQLPEKQQAAELEKVVKFRGTTTTDWRTRARYLPMVMADKTVGLITVQMIMMALFHRERSGEGQSIEIPMFENMAAFVLTEHMYLKTFQPPRGPTGDPRLLDPQAKPLATKDGYICISANTNAQAFAFFDAIGRPELKTDPRFDSLRSQ